jgi:hypothetical protein
LLLLFCSLSCSQDPATAEPGESSPYNCTLFLSDRYNYDSTPAMIVEFCRLVYVFHVTGLPWKVRSYLSDHEGGCRYLTQRFIIVFIKGQNWPISWAVWIQSKLSHILWGLLNIIISPCLSNDLFFRGSATKIVNLFLSQMLRALPILCTCIWSP